MQITNEDNMELMARYPDKYFELAIVDPPYGIDADIKNSGANSASHLKNSKAKIKTYKTG
jgi:site-specific DNA-methyltransferase (adenine-specific)